MCSCALPVLLFSFWEGKKKREQVRFLSVAHLYSVFETMKCAAWVRRVLYRAGSGLRWYFTR